MDVEIDSGSEVWKDYAGKTLGDLQGAALAIGEALYETDPVRALDLQEAKNAISSAAMEVARNESGNAIETLFLLCCIAADISITALAAIDRYKFKLFLEDM